MPEKNWDGIDAYLSDIQATRVLQWNTARYVLLTHAAIVSLGLRQECTLLFKWVLFLSAISVTSLGAYLVCIHLNALIHWSRNQVVRFGGDVPPVPEHVTPILTCVMVFSGLIVSSLVSPIEILRLF